jgi:hypothetical protein
LSASDEPDRIEMHGVAQCAQCQASLVGIRVAIDLQKMNWKFRPGVHEQTGISLKESLPDTPRGEYPREHEDTGR